MSLLSVNFNEKKSTSMNANVLSMTQNVSTNEKKDNALDYKDPQPNIWGMPVYDPRLVLADRLVEQISDAVVDHIFQAVTVKAIENDINVAPLASKIEENGGDLPSDLKDRLSKIMVQTMFSRFLKRYDDKEAKEMLEEFQAKECILSSKLREDILNYQEHVNDAIFTEVLSIISELQK